MCWSPNFQFSSSFHKILSIDWLIGLDWLIDWLDWFDWLIDWLAHWIGSLDWSIDWIGLVDWLIDWSIDRLIDWLIGLVDWLIDWIGLVRLIDWLAHWIGWLIDWLIDCFVLGEAGNSTRSHWCGATRHGAFQCGHSLQHSLWENRRHGCWSWRRGAGGGNSRPDSQFSGPVWYGGRGARPEIEWRREAACCHRTHHP